MALNYQIFILQNAFAPSGLNGLATMIQYMFHFSVGYFSLIINIPLAVYCWLFVHKRFALRTITFTLVFSGALLYLSHGGRTVHPAGSRSQRRDQRLHLRDGDPPRRKHGRDGFRRRIRA